MELKDRNDDLYEFETLLGGRMITKSVVFEDENEKIIPGISEVPERVVFNEYNRDWTPEGRDGAYKMYKNDGSVKVYTALVKEGLKVKLPKKMTGKLNYSVNLKKSGIKEL